jgi:hypothetical protein
MFVCVLDCALGCLKFVSHSVNLDRLGMRRTAPASAGGSTYIRRVPKLIAESWRFRISRQTAWFVFNQRSRLP